jgi:prolyl-tRNA editing enzyme YbaK/EbsC (Cys-tRNA(Pro) deacylase)
MLNESLTKDKEITFNAGFHDELLQLSYADFEQQVNSESREVFRTAGRGVARSVAL